MKVKPLFSATPLELLVRTRTLEVESEPVNVSPKALFGVAVVEGIALKGVAKSIW